MTPYISEGVAEASAGRPATITEGSAVPAPGLAATAAAWQESWDRQQEGFMPDREERLAAMLDAVEAVVDTDSPRLLDLAGGTGTITLRALARFPRARVTLIDLDPALLALARASLGDPACPAPRRPRHATP
ncbi:class I SAM-dependent methyltransferase [Micromonospora sp. WMMD712]|uniref:class I SAM-dependent methyltransferase n=1 Tax=Micromonospora sp. WMMD712 TaxID=3016096 RepID=UPI0032B47E2F